MRNKRARALTMIAAAAAGACSIAIGASGAYASGSAASSTLFVGSSQNPFSTFNPFSSGVSTTSSEALYDSLTRLSPTGQPIPSLATSWKINGLHVTLQIRKGIKFADGHPLNAAAVAANLKYGAAHASGSDLSASCYSYIAGIKTKVPSPYTLNLTLATPAPGLLSEFAQCNGFIVEPKYLSKQSSLTTSSYGTGPYTYSSADSLPGHRIVFVQRPGYWDAKDFPFQKLVFNFYSSNTALDNAGKSGQIEMTFQIFDPLTDTSGLTLETSGHPDEFRGFYLGDVTGAIAKPLGDIRVRQAMEYAINRQEIVKALYGKYASVSGSTPFPTQYLGYRSALANYYPYDPTKAKQLLAAAGYSSGFTINALVDPPDATFAQAIAGYLQAVGITLNISVHSNDFITQMLGGTWPMVTGNYTLNPAEFETIDGIAGPQAFWNPRHNTSPEVTTLLGQIQKAAPAAQAALYKKLANVLQADAWYLNPAFVSTVFGVNKSKLNVKITPGLSFPELYDIAPK